MEPTKENSGNFGLLFLAVVIDLLGFGIIIPILPFLAKDVNPNQEGFLLALLLAGYSFAQFIFAPIWGRISDKVGRRPIILIGLFGSAISFTMFAIVRTYILYLLSRVLAGIFTGATLPTSRAYIADIKPPEERAKYFGYLGAAFGIGFTFGPVIGSLLSLDIFKIPGLPPQAAPSLFAALLAFLNFILARSKLPESLHIRDENVDYEQISPISSFANIFEMAQQYKLTLLLLIFGMTTMIFAGFESILALFANTVDSRINEKNIGYFFGFIGIVMVIVQSKIVGPVVNGLGEEKAIALAMTFQMIGFGLLGFANNLILLFIMITPLGFGTALINPAINSAISNRIPKEHQGSGLGINSSIGSLGRVIGPIYGGLLYDNLYPSAPFTIGATIILVILLASMKQLLNDQRKIPLSD